MNAISYLALEKLAKGGRTRYKSEDISALIIDKFGSYEEFYLIASHFLSECVATDRKCEINEVAPSEVANLFRKGQDKIKNIKENNATDLGLRNCAATYNSEKFNIVAKSNNGIKTSEKQFNETHTVPDFTPRDVLIAKALEMVTNNTAKIQSRK